jgi:hypothetical protein
LFREELLACTLVQDKACADNSVEEVGAIALARKLTVKIGTVSEDAGSLENGAAFNQYLKSVVVHVTDKQIIIDCDVDVRNWVEVGQCYPLLVRVFDEDGEHLTHFVTTERFTGSGRIHANFETMMNRVKNLPEDHRKQLGYFPPILLKATGNRLIYPVARRYLKDAALVEIGFRRP